MKDERTGNQPARLPFWGRPYFCGTQGNHGPEQYAYDVNTGNLSSKAGVNYTYGDANHKHAVTSLSNGNSYGYDANGNMTSRTVSGQSYTLGYDAENQMTSVSGAATASFVYDGDGVRVVGVEDGTTTVTIGNYFEWKGSTSTMVKYYYAGAERVAMRTGTANPLWLLSDHLGSTSTVANMDGSLATRQGYKAWGEQRLPAGNSPLPTTFRYTGQRESSSLGLYFYGARWYDPYLNRWTSPDLIIPDPNNPQAYDRYAYTYNNPVRYRDPSGHWIESALDVAFIGYDIYDISQNGLNWENGLSLAADVAGLVLPAVTGGGVLVRAFMHADDVGDVAKISNKALTLSDNAIAFGKKLVENISEKVHHLASDKNATWTPILKNLAQKYGNLNGNWNKVKVPQNSNHPEQYHRWIADALAQIDLVAQGDLKKFQELYQIYVTETVKENPWLLKKAWWEKYGEEFWKWWETIVKEGL